MAKEFEAAFVEFTLVGIQGCPCGFNAGENCSESAVMLGLVTSED